MRSLAAQFGPALRAHLTLAFQDLQVYSQRRSCGSKEQSASLNTEEALGSPERPQELFQVLLQSQEEAVPCRYLLQEALVQRCATLAVLAACQQVTQRSLLRNSVRNANHQFDYRYLSIQRWHGWINLFCGPKLQKVTHLRAMMSRC